jgi:hypothetical protein
LSCRRERRGRASPRSQILERVDSLCQHRPHRALGRSPFCSDRLRQCPLPASARRRRRCQIESGPGERGLAPCIALRWAESPPTRHRRSWMSGRGSPRLIRSSPHTRRGSSRQSRPSSSCCALACRAGRVLPRCSPKREDVLWLKPLRATYPPRRSRSPGKCWSKDSRWCRSLASRAPSRASPGSPSFSGPWARKR